MGRWVRVSGWARHLQRNKDGGRAWQLSAARNFRHQGEAGISAFFLVRFRENSAFWEKKSAFGGKKLRFSTSKLRFSTSKLRFLGKKLRFFGKKTPLFDLKSPLFREMGCDDYWVRCTKKTPGLDVL